MNQNLLEQFGNPVERVEKALEALRNGEGVLVADDENRENEGDIIHAAENMTEAQMALMIRECSGIVCLCLTPEMTYTLDLPLMVPANGSRFGTNFTVSIEASEGVTTGVSAKDRITTIQAAIADNAHPDDLQRPGHVFPLKARKNGVLDREGHTEASVDLCRLAGLKPAGVLSELTNEDGTMAKLPELVAFGKKHKMTVLTVADIILYRQTTESKDVA